MLLFSYKGYELIKRRTVAEQMLYPQALLHKCRVFTVGGLSTYLWRLKLVGYLQYGWLNLKQGACFLKIQHLVKINALIYLTKKIGMLWEIRVFSPWHGIYAATCSRNKTKKIKLHLIGFTFRSPSICLLEMLGHMRGYSRLKTIDD